MKLRSLHLEGFGFYRDRTIPFQPGLTLIYGPNETGKTTLLQAVRMLLFGERKNFDLSSYDDWTKFRLTATAELSGSETVTFTRTNARKEPISGRKAGQTTGFTDDDLKAELQISGTAYRTLFGFSQQELADGENALRESELGDVLFDGGIGDLEAFRQLEMRLRRDAESLHKDRGRTQQVDHAMDDVAEAARSVDEETVHPAEYDRQRNNLAEREQHLARLKSQSTTLERERAALERRLRAEPLVKKLRQRADEQDALELESPLPLADCDDIDRRIAAVRQTEKAIVEHEEQLRTHREAAARAEPNAILLAAADTIATVERMRRDLAPREEAYLTRRQSRDEKQRTLALREPVAETLEELRDRLACVRRLEKTATKIDADLLEATATRRQLRRQLDEVSLAGEPASELSLDAETSGPARHDAIDRLVRRLESRLDDAAAALQRHDVWAAELEHRTAALCQDGGVKEITASPVWPLEAEQQQLAEDVTRTSREAEEVCRLAEEAKAESDRIAQRLAELEAGSDTPSRSLLQTLRTQRDEQVDTIASTIESKTFPDEAAFVHLRDQIDAADQAVDRRYEHANMLLELERTRVQQTHAEKACDEAASRLREAEAVRERAAAAWRHLWESRSLPCLRPAIAKQWRESVEKLTDEQAAMSRWLDDAAAFAGDVSQLSQLLDDDRRPAPHVDRLDPAIIEEAARLIAAGKRWCSAFTEQETLRRQRELDRPRLERETAETEERLAALGTARAEVHAELTERLGPGLAAQPFEAIETELEAAVATKTLALEVDVLTDSLAADEAAISEFQSTAEELTARFIESVGALPLREAVSALANQLEDSRTQQKLRDNEQEHVTRIQRSLDELRDRQTKQTDDLLAHGEPHITALEHRVAASRNWHEFAKESEADRRTLVEIADGEPLDAFTEAVAEGDPIDWKSDVAECKQKLSGLAGEIEQANKEVTRQDDRLSELSRAVEGNQRQLQLESSRAVLRDVIDRYAPLAIALHRIERAKKRFETEMRPQLLDDVSELLEKLTDGQHVRVGREVEVNQLYVEAAGGQRVRKPSELSTGTRQLLYLAIRLAYIRNHVRDRRPVPVLLDDVLVHLDDERAERVLKVLHELSEHVQIVLLSCHGRLLQHAKSLSIEDCILRLDESAQAAAEPTDEFAKSDTPQRRDEVTPQRKTPRKKRASSKAEPSSDTPLFNDEAGQV